MITFIYINILNLNLQIGYAVSKQVVYELIDRWCDEIEPCKLVSMHDLDFEKLDEDDIIYEDCFGGYTKQHFTLNRK